MYFVLSIMDGVQIRGIVNKVLFSAIVFATGFGLARGYYPPQEYRYVGLELRDESIIHIVDSVGNKRFTLCDAYEDGLVVPTSGFDQDTDGFEVVRVAERMSPEGFYQTSRPATDSEINSLEQLFNEENLHEKMGSAYLLQNLALGVGEEPNALIY